MNIFAKLNELHLDGNNSVIIGSGILDVLGIRKGVDVDVVVRQDAYERLKADGRFLVGQTHGREVLTDELFEIGTSWGVLGKDHTFDDLMEHSQTIDGVRYISPEFLLAVKQSWLKAGNARQKDVNDVELMQQFLASL